MSITFRCEGCHKMVEAPDSAAGRRGKCPHCGQSSYIPEPSKEEEVIPFAPEDEAEEKALQEEIKSLLAKEHDILHEMGGGPEMPLEHKEDLSSQDLHHFVVNFCLDRFKGNLARADEHIRKLKPFKFTAIEAVEEIENGKAREPVLDAIPKKLLEAFLKDLKANLRI